MLATDAEHDAAAERPIEPPGDGDAERRGDERLGERAGNGDGADREEVVEREMEPDAEHQKNHADIGELVGDALIGDVTGREGSDQDAGEEITDERRELEAVGDEAQAEGEPESYGKRRNERGHVRHERTSGAGSDDDLA